jgi:predicted acetyltransferase
VMQLSVLNKTAGVFTLDESLTSVIIGYEKRGYSNLKMAVLSLLSLSQIARSIGKNDFKTYATNVKSISKALDLKWHHRHIKGNYYRINIVAVSKEERGKGVFRKLIIPIIDYCNNNRIPVILESNNSGTTLIYEHFGFKLVETIAKEGVDLSQYCFIKYPN